MDTEGMNYGLTIAVLARTPFVEITQQEFKAAKRAKEIVAGSLGIEETLNLVFANYIEYETELLSGALQCLVYSVGSWSDFKGRIHEVNRRVVNLLSACRAYLDQTCHYIGEFFGKESVELNQFRSWTATEYDSSLGYRAMEALRNYTQHRGIGIHRLSHENWRVGEGETSIRHHSLVPFLEPHRFAEEGGFKASVLAELMVLGEVVDLSPLVKDYVSGIARIHDQLRTLMTDHVKWAEQEILTLIDHYKEAGQPDVMGLTAVMCNSEGIWLDKVWLSDEPIKRLQSLSQKMQGARYLSKNYTTNEPKR